MINEKQLIESCIKGDRKAQKELYDTYARKMMSVCFRYAGEYELAKDLLQEGFIRVFSNLNAYQFIGSFEGWVRKIFVNTSLEYLRRNDLLREALDIDTNISVNVKTENTVIEELSAEDLMKIISELPPGFRTVFNMYAIEGYSHKEIADILGITESTSRSQLTRARMLLQKRINELL
nr:RNA polymerase sigma factor [Parabacteroides sp. FAFU027]